MGSYSFCLFQSELLWDAMQPGAVPNFVSDFHTFNEAAQTSLNEELSEAFSGVSKGKEEI